MQWGEFEQRPAEKDILQQAAEVANAAAKNPYESPTRKIGVLGKLFTDRIERERSLHQEPSLSQEERKKIADDITFLDLLIPKLVDGFKGTTDYIRISEINGRFKKQLKEINAEDEKKWQSIIKQFD